MSLRACNKTLPSEALGRMNTGRLLITSTLQSLALRSGLRERNPWARTYDLTRRNRMAWKGSLGAPSKLESLMAYSGVRELIVENRHSGERLAMRRVKRGDDVWLELKGLLPAHRQGPPLHIHVAEDEEGVVRSGTLSAVLNDRRFTVGSGERVSLPRGSTHRWWNDGNEPLVFEGYARPVVDLDRFIHALFEVDRN